MYLLLSTTDMYPNGQQFSYLLNLYATHLAWWQLQTAYNPLETISYNKVLLTWSAVLNGHHRYK